MYLKKAIKKLEQINWETYKKKITEKILLNEKKLFLEYLRRYAIFFKKMNRIKNDDVNILGIHSDFIFFMQVLLDLSKEKKCELYQKYEYLFLNIPDINQYKEILFCYIYIAILIDNNEIEEEAFYIYDPLFKIIENGGKFWPRGREEKFNSGGQIFFYDWYKNSINREPIDIENLELEFENIKKD